MVPPNVLGGAAMRDAEQVTFAGGSIDRAAWLRDDADRLDALLHDPGTRVLPLWREKEPVIDKFVRQRFAAPLFFERSVIEVTPRRVVVWVDGSPQVYDVRPGHEAA